MSEMMMAVVGFVAVTAFALIAGKRCIDARKERDDVRRRYEDKRRELERALGEVERLKRQSGFDEKTIAGQRSEILRYRALASVGRRHIAVRVTEHAPGAEDVGCADVALELPGMETYVTVKRMYFRADDAEEREFAIREAEELKEVVEKW